MRVVVPVICAGLLAIILMLSVQKFYRVEPSGERGKIANDIQFEVEEISDTALTVRAIESRSVLATFQKGTFAYSVFRNLRSERKRNRVNIESPFRLVRYETGDLALKDLETGSSVYIKAFGHSNAEAFDALFAAGLLNPR